MCRIEQRSLISLLIQRKNSQGLTIAVDSSPFGRADREITAKAMADLGCVHCRLQQIELMHNNLSPGSNENYWGCLSRHYGDFRVGRLSSQLGITLTGLRLRDYGDSLRDSTSAVQRTLRAQPVFRYLRYHPARQH